MGDKDQQWFPYQVTLLSECQSRLRHDALGNRCESASGRIEGANKSRLHGLCGTLAARARISLASNIPATLALSNYIQPRATWKHLTTTSFSIPMAHHQMIHVVGLSHASKVLSPSRLLKQLYVLFEGFHEE